MFRFAVLPCFDLCRSKSFHVNTQLGVGRHLELGVTWSWASLGVGRHLELGVTWSWASLGVGRHLELGVTWSWASLGVGRHLELGVIGGLITPVHSLILS